MGAKNYERRDSTHTINEEEAEREEQTSDDDSFKTDSSGDSILDQLEELNDMNALDKQL